MNLLKSLGLGKVSGEDKIGASEPGCMLVCTVFDLGARDHGPIFCSPTLPVLWRNVEALLKESPLSVSEYLVFVHGEFDRGGTRVAFHPYAAPVVYRADDRSVLSSDGTYEAMLRLEESYAKRS